MAEALLITGGAGFIGSNFADYVLSRYPETRVTVLDRFTYAGRPANLAPARERYGDRLETIRGDVRDEALAEELIRSRGISLVANFAAESHVDRSIADPRDFVGTNVAGACALLGVCLRLRAAAGGPVTRFLQISTDEVYGSLDDPGAPPFTERSPYAPSSPYAASKAAADLMAGAFFRTYGLDVVVTHGANTYGPRQHPEKLLPLAITRALAGREIPVYGSGLQTREWLFVTDHCRAADLALRRGAPGAHYNVGGEPLANNEILAKTLGVLAGLLNAEGRFREKFRGSPLLRGLDPRSLIRHVADRPGHDFRYAPGDGRIARELGFRRETGLDEGLKLTVAWYLENLRPEDLA